MTTRDDLHHLVDALPVGEMQAAQRFLEYLRAMDDPFLRALATAPVDDEPERKGEKTAVAEGHRDLKAGRLVSSDKIWNEIA